MCIKDEIAAENTGYNVLRKYKLGGPKWIIYGLYTVVYIKGIPDFSGE